MTEQDATWSDLHDSLGRPLEKMPDEVFPATNAVLFDGSGRVLLQKRSDNGAWGLPGGRMEIGETVEQCVIRETFEETGMLTSNRGLVVTMEDGSEFQITIVQSRMGRG